MTCPAVQKKEEAERRVRTLTDGSRDERERERERGERERITKGVSEDEEDEK